MACVFINEQLKALATKVGANPYAVGAILQSIDRLEDFDDSSLNDTALIEEIKSKLASNRKNIKFRSSRYGSPFFMMGHLASFGKTKVLMMRKGILQSKEFDRLLEKNPALRASLLQEDPFSSKDFFYASAVLKGLENILDTVEDGDRVVINGFSLNDTSKSQAKIDQMLIDEVFPALIKHPNFHKVSKFIVNGETGLEEAFAKAAILYNTPTEIIALRDHIISGKKKLIVADKKAFFGRFKGYEDYINTFTYKRYDPNTVSLVGDYTIAISSTSRGYSADPLSNKILTNHKYTNDVVLLPKWLGDNQRKALFNGTPIHKNDLLSLLNTQEEASKMGLGLIDGNVVNIHNNEVVIPKEIMEGDNNNAYYEAAYKYAVKQLVDIALSPNAAPVYLALDPADWHTKFFYNALEAEIESRGLTPGDIDNLYFPPNYNTNLQEYFEATREKARHTYSGTKDIERPTENKFRQTFVEHKQQELIEYAEFIMEFYVQRNILKDSFIKENFIENKKNIKKYRALKKSKVGGVDIAFKTGVINTKEIFDQIVDVFRKMSESEEYLKRIMMAEYNKIGVSEENAKEYVERYWKVRQQDINELYTILKNKDEGSYEYVRKSLFDVFFKKVNMKNLDLSENSKKTDESAELENKAIETGESSEESTQEVIEENNEEFFENLTWDDKSVSAKQSATQKLRMLLESQFDEDRLSSIGFPKKVGQDKMFAILVDSLHMHKTSSKMMEGLRELAQSYSYFNPIIREIEKEASSNTKGYSETRAALFTAISRNEELFVIESIKVDYDYVDENGNPKQYFGYNDLTRIVNVAKSSKGWHKRFIENRHNPKLFDPVTGKFSPDENYKRYSHTPKVLEEVLVALGAPYISKGDLKNYLNSQRAKNIKRGAPGASATLVKRIKELLKLYDHELEGEKGQKLFKQIATEIEKEFGQKRKEHSVKVDGKPKYIHSTPSFIKQRIDILTNKDKLSPAEYIERLEELYFNAKSQYIGEFAGGIPVIYNYILRNLIDDAMLQLNSSKAVFNPGATVSHGVITLLRNLGGKEYKEYSMQEFFYTLFNGPNGDKFGNLFPVGVYAENKNHDMLHVKQLWAENEDSQKRYFDALSLLALGELARIHLVQQRSKTEGIKKYAHFDTGRGSKFVMFSELESRKEELLQRFERAKTDEKEFNMLLQEIEHELVRSVDNRFLEAIEFLDKNFVDFNGEGIFHFKHSREAEDDIKEIKIDPEDKNTASKINTLLTYLKGNMQVKAYNMIMQDAELLSLLDSNDVNIEFSMIKELRKYHNNFILARASIIGLTTVDSAFVKNDIEFQKRQKELRAAMNRLDIEQMDVYDPKTGKAMQTSLNIKDIVYASNSIETFKEFYTKNASKYFSSQEADFILGKLGSIEATDGQSFRTFDSYMDIMKAVGKYSEIEALDVKMQVKREGKNIKFTPEEIGMFLQSIKPYAFGLNMVDDGLGGKILIPVQHKNSESALLAILEMLPEGIVPVDSSLNELMRAIRDHNNSIGNKAGRIDVVHFSSTTKKGAIANNDSITESTTREDIRAMVANSMNYQTTNYEEYGIQVENPEHLLDHTMALGTQFKSLIISNIEDDMHVQLPWGSSLTGEEIMNYYNDLLIAKARKGYNRLKEQFKNIYELREILLAEIDRNPERYPANIRQALDIRKVNGVKQFRTPLFDPAYREAFSNIINSIIRKGVVKHEINGGTATLVSSVIVGNDLQIKFSEDGKSVEYVEAYLPAYTKRLIHKYIDVKTGQIDMSKIKDDKVLELIGYRVPTEDKYSMAPIKVKGFLPYYMGSTIMMPHDYLVIAGWDYDIDKLYLLYPELSERDITDEEGNKVDSEYYVDYGGKKKVADLSESEMNNRLIALSHAILTNSKSAQHVLNKGGYDNLVSAVKKITTIKEGNVDPDTKFEDIQESSEGAGIPNVLSFTYDLYFREQNQVGLRMVSISAVHNTHHATLQGSDTFMTVPVVVNGKNYSNLSGSQVVQNVNGSEVIKYISKIVSSGLAASVDNVKDPVLASFGITESNANLAYTMLRLGIPDYMVGLILNTPIIRQLSRGSMNISEIDSILEEYKKSIPEELIEASKNDLSIKEKDVIQMVSTGTPQYDSVAEFKLLSTVRHILKSANLLSNLMEQHRQDAAHKSIGKDANSVVLQIMNMDETATKLTSENAALATNSYLTSDMSVEEFWKEMSDPKYKKKNLQARKKHQALFSMTNELAKMYYSNHSFELTEGMMQILNAVKKGMPSHKFDESVINTVISDYITYYMSDLPFFGNEYAEDNTDELVVSYEDKRNDILLNTPDYIIHLIHTYPQLMSNALLSNLSFAPSGNILTIEFPAVSTHSRLSLDEITRAWEELYTMNTEDAEFNAHAKNLAENLYRYAYYKYGLGFDIKSFSKLVPEVLKDSIRGYGRKLREARTSLVSPQDIDLNRFLSQLFHNRPQYDRNTFYPSELLLKNLKRFRSLSIMEDTLMIKPILPSNMDKDIRNELYNRFQNKQNPMGEWELVKFPKVISIDGVMYSFAYIAPNGDINQVIYQKVPGEAGNLRYDINNQGEPVNDWQYGITDSYGRMYDNSTQLNQGEFANQKVNEKLLNNLCK